MQKNRLLCLCLSAASLLSASLATSVAYAWGERGHDACSRIAARLLADHKDPETAKFGAFLQKKENMLGHLANVPDIVWRSMGAELDKTSSPAHFVDLDFILAPGPLPLAEKLPSTIDAYVKALDKNCARKSKDYPCVSGKTIEEKLQKAGHAPFRIESLSQDLLQAFKELKALEIEPGKSGEPGVDQSEGSGNGQRIEKKNAIVDRVLLLSGILSHYVGDIANPHHTSADYDGWDSGQGGLHGYFESDIVDSLSLDLEATVFDEAQRHEPMAARFAKHPHNYLEQAWELVIDSHEKLAELTRVDMQNAVLQKSMDRESKDEPNGKDQTKSSRTGPREKAKRKAVAETRQVFRNLVILRLAAGADALSRIWLDTWQQAGKPDLSFYRSYHYDVKPEFIPMRYLPSK